MARALVIVDVQNDFCEGGSLAVSGGAEVASRISDYIRRYHPSYHTIVATRDWHIKPGDHFASNTDNPTPNFSTTWPDHCVADTEGAMYHPNLELPVSTVHFYKGMDKAAYSGFEGMMDPSVYGHISLNGFLKGRDTTAIDVCGIATDYCVKATVMDGLRLGYQVNIIPKLMAAVDPETGRQAVIDMTEAGAQVFASFV